MSCSTICVIDADDLQESSFAPPVRTGTKKTTIGLLSIFTLWRKRSRQRRELRELARSPALLKDTNLSYYDVQYEGNKPFWRK